MRSPRLGGFLAKILRGKHVGKYLTAVDLDNRLAIDEFSNYGGTKVRWQDITLTETRDGKDKLHLYFITYEQIPDKQVDNAPEMIDKKDANLVPSIEVKGSRKKLIYPTPDRGYHPLSPIEIVDFTRMQIDKIRQTLISRSQNEGLLIN